MRLLITFGTRPEALKLAPLILAAKKDKSFETIVCATGQHREIVEQANQLFGIVPDYDLSIMQPGQTLHELTARVLINLSPVIDATKPDWLLVQGDTTTVMAASLLSFYHRVKVGHVEAGLRTEDKFQPFPEEINRRIASVIADLHFAPTAHAEKNLLREGIPAKNIVVTGNTIIDTLQLIARKPYDLENSLLKNIPFDKKLVLVTAHRRENFGDPLMGICAAIKELTNIFAEHIHFVYPVHPNPNVHDVVHRELGNNPGITLLPPIDYESLVFLLKNAVLVLTDSGGIQEEAPTFGVKVLIMRETTERPEGIEAGVAKLVGTDPQKIIAEVIAAWKEREQGQKPLIANPYGDGQATARILKALKGNPSDEDIQYRVDELGEICEPAIINLNNLEKLVKLEPFAR
jgi:UDP-N-acetylglucosamine 2-epimerase (non-hydrolysing)